MIEHPIVSEKHLIDFRGLLVAFKSSGDMFEGDQKDEQDFSKLPLLFRHLTTLDEVDDTNFSTVIIIGEIEKETSDCFA